MVEPIPKAPRRVNDRACKRHSNYSCGWGDLVWRFGSSPVLFLAARRQGINVVGVGEAVGLIACESDQKQKVGMT